MSLPKLAVDTKQLIIEGALTNAWLEGFGVLQTRDSTDIDVAKLAAGGADVHALAKTAEERGHAGKLTFAMLQALPGAEAIARVGADQRSDIKQADAVARANAIFTGISDGLQRATEAMERATHDLQELASDCPNISFQEFLARLSPESNVMSAVKLLRAAEKQLGALEGKNGFQALWASTRAQREAVWPSAANAFAAYTELFSAMAETGEVLQGMEMGEAVLRSQAIATVAQMINQSVSSISESTVYFRSADEVSAEAKAMHEQQSRGADRVLEARQAFVEAYCNQKGWPLDPAKLSIDQIKEIRAQEAWINAGRP